MWFHSRWWQDKQQTGCLPAFLRPASQSGGSLLFISVKGSLISPLRFSRLGSLIPGNEKLPGIHFD
jgi:hypothetical protein